MLLQVTCEASHVVLRIAAPGPQEADALYRLILSMIADGEPIVLQNRPNTRGLYWENGSERFTEC